ncbi:bifunctional demethylmenaquinone methyltransferase/2-methoxy-6-polyprenyl-1,4-benzoquinol methylase [Coxiella-like endosymbiont of Rhipicephalus sanguineus]|uniref:bifunctional demethylmenaquinone methyltransferase/2-methoxy-6-polyprenyl-1,4-benzoquinol methylase UbiE n=1 Tax=Coxiella-like endosymbiont of Rhipicephalus sanguineus TaxID=1955402 RepID=UPI00203B93DD|nr:bifunctional demethylmenaquinone methyltransferase/2-methoxy-6-polyprenyl-1,4-benzoquinol methylase UbiE [Coxiella-like endosymbiont of Rhipicephalus sanguineus]MBT8506231.1 bifunctional demethylmenaquinone methyltransferase/2-methoxy-6-polyprenyl-1,4-benzoquinol methylase [Coxiella-like endosymbiont of Rhipicephalus sanguineus]
MNKIEKTTYFGYQIIPENQKTDKVKNVFKSVASKYDLMNDLMSLGIHRFWKDFAIKLSQLRPGHQVLDLAGGTGDLAKRISLIIGNNGTVVLTDINDAMLTIGRNRLLDQGIFRNIQFIQANAEVLPFPNNFFDRIIIGFGLRNVTDKMAALHSMYRVLKPGGLVTILEFSKPHSPLQDLYDLYSFKLLPWLGKKVANDEESYRYLVESIRMHPDQKNLIKMMTEAGLEDCDYHNLSGGIVAVHRGYKF